jgi:hypothetical protein
MELLESIAEADRGETIRPFEAGESQAASESQRGESVKPGA